jgi:hypothetical protein
MTLTRDDWIKLIAAAVFTLFAHWFLREWYQPDIRYGTGRAYMSTNLAVYSVQLKNMGHADAENVIVSATFVDPLVDISTGEMGLHFNLTGGGKGEKFVTGTLQRLVPGETTNIFFLTQPTLPWSPQDQFIRIKFNGGLGKTGLPWRHWVLLLVVFGIFFGAVQVGLWYLGRKVDANYSHQLREAIQLGFSAAQEGISAEQLKTRVEDWYRKISVFKKPRQVGVMTAAEAAFTGANQIGKGNVG